jgi:PAS domain S-box-containing protein
MHDDLDPTPADGPAPPANVLLVDDDPANLLALEALLAGPGRNLVKARSGEEALRHLLAEDFAVVLLDVQMPGLDGFETARLVRGRERSRHTPIIFVTAHDSPGPTVAEAYALGGVDFLVKPLVPEVVRAKVAVFVDLFEKAEQVTRQAERLRLMERREYERRVADEARRQTEERFRLLADSAPVLLWVSGPDGRCTYFNRPWLEFTGRTLEQELGDGWAEGVHPDDRGACLDTYRAALRTRQPFRMEYRLRGADGTYRWVLDTGTPRPDPGGAFAGFIGSAIDITDRKEAEEQLRRSQSELTDFVENATVGLHWVGPDGTILWANRAELEMLGYDRDEYVDRPVADFHADPEVIADILRRLTGDEALCNYEARLRCKDGSIRHVLINSSAYREGDRFRHTRCFTRDITDRKRLEEALRQRAEELAERDRRKDEFLAMLAHELRNPLAPVLNGLHILRLSEADRRAVEQARGMIERQIRHLTRLVDDLLDVSRITHGGLRVRRERLDLARLVRTAAEDRRPTVEQAGMALAVEVPDLPVWVTGDATRLTQVLNNLLDNAVKFRNGGAEVTVRLTAEAGPGRAVIDVRDRGVGIEPDLFPRLFDPFAQADRSLDRPRGGLGLGLSIVKALVDQHGGEVRAASDGPGRGAAFTVRLPLAGEPAALSSMPPAAPPPAGGPLRVLVVEDNRDAADSLRVLLELLGHEFKIAYTGPEGVRAAREWRPDIVLCDIGLPGLDGYGVAGELRRDPVTARSHLIAVTGYGQEEDRRRARQAGFHHHLTKPVDPADLQTLLVRPA